MISSYHSEIIFHQVQKLWILWERIVTTRNFYDPYGKRNGWLSLAYHEVHIPAEGTGLSKSNPTRIASLSPDIYFLLLLGLTFCLGICGPTSQQCRSWPKQITTFYSLPFQLPLWWVVARKTATEIWDGGVFLKKVLLSLGRGQLCWCHPFLSPPSLNVDVRSETEAAILAPWDKGWEN